MNKLSVLLIFAQANAFLTPDLARRNLHTSLDRRSFYSYLARLRKQGLLEKAPNSPRGNLRYRITDRGRQRINYLRTRKTQP